MQPLLKMLGQVCIDRECVGCDSGFEAGSLAKGSKWILIEGQGLVERDN